MSETKRLVEDLTMAQLDDNVPLQQKIQKMKGLNDELYNQLFLYIHNSIPKHHSFGEVQSLLNSLSQSPTIDVTFK